MKIHLSLVRLLIACLTPGLALSLQTLQPSDIANIQKVSDPQISPNGKWVAYVVEIPGPVGSIKNAHIWIVAADGSRPTRPFLLSERTDTSPRWSPDGRTLAFLSDRANPLADGRTGYEFHAVGLPNPPPPTQPDEQQIWEISLDGGEAYPLTHIPGGVKSFKWSHDGQSLVFVRTDPDTPTEAERKKQKRDQILVDHNYHFDRLWVYRRASHTATLVTHADMNIDDFDLSPDGFRVIARVSPTPRLNDYWHISKIQILNLSTGEPTQTLCNVASYEKVHWFRSADKVLYGEKTAQGIASYSVAEDLTTGRKTEIGRSINATLRLLDWMPDGQALAVQGVEGTRTFFARVDLTSGQLRDVSYVPSDGYAFTQSDDGQTIAYLGQTATRPDDIWIYRGRAVTQSLANHNPQSANWNLAAVKEISWKSSKDGRKIYGVLLLPPDFQAGTPHKTLVHAHGGPFEAWQSGWIGSWYDWGQLLASHGYVVLEPNPRGSQGQGVDFTEANYRDWGYGDFQDVMDGVDLLIKEKIAGPDKLGIGGWSYGGFMTSWAITHTNRFKAAMVGAAVTDLYGMSTTTDIAPSYFTEFFGNFIQNRKLYDEHSPMRFVENCATPALVLHGDADLRVPTFQGAEFYKALQMLGRESQFVRYPREPHIFTEREHQIDSLQRMIDWFDSHIH